MANIRTLKLNLLADVDQFARQLNKADKDVKGFSGNLKKYGKVAAAAFGVAAVAAGTYAIKLGIDSVEAAIEDEKSQKTLAKALQNTTKATDSQIKATEEYITKQQLTYGISDSKLRPAFANLARVTGNLGESQKLTNLAMDISASTGKDLETVSLTLAKAYDGNFGALKRLGIPLDENIIKTGDFNVVQAELNRLFGGAAQANTETYAGKLAILKERFSEVQEGLGVKLLPKLTNLLDIVIKVSKAMSGEDPDGLTNRARELAGEVNDKGEYSLGRSIVVLGEAFQTMFEALTGPKADGSVSTLESMANSIVKLAAAMDKISAAYKKAKPFLEFFDVTAKPKKFIWDWLTSDANDPAKAAGGSVMGGKAYTVGEFGPETFVPAGSGSIRPNGGLGGGVTIIMNGVIDGESARRSIEKLLQDSSRRTGAVNLVGATL
jgi:hypothetical protein